MFFSIRRTCFVFSLVLLLFAGPAWAQKEAKAPLRIISLSPAHTEVLLRLGAKDNIIGVSAHESYAGPETEGWKPKVYGINDSLRKFKAAKPDYVLIRPIHLIAASQLVAQLEGAGINVRYPHAFKATELYKYWRELGVIAGREEEAEKLVADFDREVARYHQAASKIDEKDKPGIFIEALHHNVKTYTPDSIAVWLVEIAGGRNVAADARPSSPALVIADYGPERLAAKGSQIDIYISQPSLINKVSKENLEARNIYKPVKAFKDGKVILIPEELLSRPTPSLLTGLQQISQLTGLTPVPEKKDVQ